MQLFFETKQLKNRPFRAVFLYAILQGCIDGIPLSYGKEHYGIPL